MLQSFYNFLGKPHFYLRTQRTSRTIRTWLYLSCSQLVPDFCEQHRWSNFATDGKSATSKNVDGGFSSSTPKSQLGTLNKRSEYTSIHARIIRHDRCSNPRGLAYGWQLLATPPHVTLIRQTWPLKNSHEFQPTRTSAKNHNLIDARHWSISHTSVR